MENFIVHPQTVFSGHPQVSITIENKEENLENENIPDSNWSLLFKNLKILNHKSLANLRESLIKVEEEETLEAIFSEDKFNFTKVPGVDWSF